MIFLAVTKKLTQECSIIYPASKVAITLRTNDTDCLIIGLSAMEKLAEDVNVWMEAGVQSTNS